MTTQTPEDRGMGGEKHTPGPWVCYADLPSTEPDWHIVTNANRMRVLANVHIEPGNEVDEANARLITATPELFDALSALMVQWDKFEASVGNYEEAYYKLAKYARTHWDSARAALAKAQGPRP